VLEQGILDQHRCRRLPVTSERVCVSVPLDHNPHRAPVCSSAAPRSSRSYGNEHCGSNSSMYSLHSYIAERGQIIDHANSRSASRNNHGAFSCCKQPKALIEFIGTALPVPNSLSPNPSNPVFRRLPAEAHFALHKITRRRRTIVPAEVQITPGGEFGALSDVY
jgi:hypothetical protein